MSSHIAHESTLDVGLIDGCPRCKEHAARPLDGLDRDHLQAFWRQMILVEYDDPDARYRSENEATCCLKLYEYARFLRTIGLDPQRVLPGQNAVGEWTAL